MQNLVYRAFAGLAAASAQTIALKLAAMLAFDM
jgi:hypothetical protein